MLVCFLDFDGVLNGNKELISRQRKRIIDKTDYKEHDLELINDENLYELWASEMVMKNINNFLESVQGFDVKIVLSTLWRNFRTIQEWNEQFLKIKGWNLEIIGRTPSLTGQIEIQTMNGYYRTNPRGLEIKTWIDENNYKGNYVIIDDDDDMLLEQKDYFLQTNSDLGFSEEDKIKLIRKLEEFK